MTQEERKIVLHTIKNVNELLDRIKGIVDSCARDIKFYEENEKQPKVDVHRTDTGAMM